MKEKLIPDFKYIWFRVPRKWLTKLFYSKERIDHEVYQKLFYYRRVLEKIFNQVQHLMSLIDTIILRH